MSLYDYIDLDVCEEDLLPEEETSFTYELEVDVSPTQTLFVNVEGTLVNGDIISCWYDGGVMVDDYDNEVRLTAQEVDELIDVQEKLYEHIDKIIFNAR